MISGDMNITEVVAEYPMTIDVFVKHGMGCLGCSGAIREYRGRCLSPWRQVDGCYGI